MKCSDLKLNLPLYLDRSLDDGDRDAVSHHLAECPLCRQRFDELRKINNGLRALRRHEVFGGLKSSLKFAVREEIRGTTNAPPRFSAEIREWLQMNLMPYGVGVMTSVVTGFVFISLMFSGFNVPGPLEVAKNRKNPQNSQLMLANANSRYNGSFSADADELEYAYSRADVSVESPSVNPRGALIALTKSLVRGRMKDDEVVVVADVFGDGLAQIAEVVEPSRDSQAVTQLQKALDSDPAYAPFVPAKLDKRSDSVRVVLKFQSVDVSTSPKRRR